MGEGERNRPAPDRRMHEHIAGPRQKALCSQPECPFPKPPLQQGQEELRVPGTGGGRLASATWVMSMELVNTKVRVCFLQKPLLSMGKFSAGREAPKDHQLEGQGKPVEETVTGDMVGPGELQDWSGVRASQSLSQTTIRLHFCIFVTLAT